MEDKLNQAHLEVQQLKASVKNYEGMIDNYKSQVVTVGGLALRVSSQLGRSLAGRRWEAEVLPRASTGFCSLGDENKIGG